MGEYIGLKPCPFCDGASHIESNSHMQLSQITCEDCGFRRQESLCEEDLIELWNTRPVDTLESTLKDATCSKEQIDGNALEVFDRGDMNIKHTCGVAEYRFGREQRRIIRSKLSDGE